MDVFWITFFATLFATLFASGLVGFALYVFQDDILSRRDKAKALRATTTVHQRIFYALLLSDVGYLHDGQGWIRSHWRKAAESIERAPVAEWQEILGTSWPAGEAILKFYDAYVKTIAYGQMLEHLALIGLSQEGISPDTEIKPGLPETALVYAIMCLLHPVAPDDTRPPICRRIFSEMTWAFQKPELMDHIILCREWQTALEQWAVYLREKVAPAELVAVPEHPVMPPPDTTPTENRRRQLPRGRRT